jgi:hypothetical protein
MSLLLLLAAQAAAATAQPAATVPDYAKDANWLCLPGRRDICSTSPKRMARP